MLLLCQMPGKNPDSQNSEHLLVFFDGICHLCNGFVDAVVSRDPSRKIHFAAYQGETAARLLRPDQRQALSTILVRDQGRWLEKSDAVLRIFQELPGWKWTVLLKALPKGLRDLVYDFVARHRYGWFGQSETCRLPTPEERESLLP